MKTEAVEVSFDDHIGTVILRRPPNNYYDLDDMTALVDAVEHVAAEPACRVVVLASEGRNFCAGAQFGGDEPFPMPEGLDLYDVVVRLFDLSVPMVAAVQGGAIGGGLGLSLAADFRVASDESFFAAPFVRVGLHHGFGLTETLPAVIGSQRATDMLLSGRRVYGDEAAQWGLCDQLVESTEIHAAAADFAASLAAGAPAAIQAIRITMRRGRTAEIAAAIAHEKAEQTRLVASADWQEAIRAGREGREPIFTGR